MRAAAVVAPRKVELVEVEVPEPAAGQVRVKVEGCGVCASNIPPFEGREWFTYPMAAGQLGHEAWGRVDAVGDGVTRWRVGQRVAFLSEKAYAEFDVADQGKVVGLPEEMEGRPFPAEPLGCTVNVFRRSGIAAGMTVAIVGVGFVGALITKMASDAGARAIAIGRRAFALDVAKRFGAAFAVPMEDHRKIIEEVKGITRGRMCEVVVEAVGKQWPLDLAGELTRERGRLVVAGYHQDGVRQMNMQAWNWKGIDVINAHEREAGVYVAGMEEAVRLVASGRIDPTRLYSHRFELEQLGEALEMTRERPDGFMKALVVM
jgi:threonine dehydrogenase-like Zn-dependent dehydrogenase